MPKNIQTTRQLHSFHMLARLSSKSGVWEIELSGVQLDFEKAKEPEIKLPVSTGS